MQKHNISSLQELHKKSISNIDWYWGAVNDDIGIVWDKKYTIVSDFSAGKPWTKWFTDGKLNIINSTVTKFAKKTPDKIAYHFVSENNMERKITYLQLENQVNKLANGLLSFGVKKGDVVAIYMPMILESIVIILACAKIGAIQTTIFSGYSSDALNIRLQDSNAKILFVSDGFSRKGKPISQKEAAQKALEQTSIEKVIVVPYCNTDRYKFSNNILDYAKLVYDQPEICHTRTMDSEDPLFILYTSGTTGKPKGVIHTHGGFAVYAGHQASYLIDLTPEDVLLWPADIGWITGQVWNVYGLLEIGATAVIYDGAIDYPNQDRVWELLSKYGVTIFGISPTATRMFRKSGVTPREKYNLSKIRIIPTTGEPIDEESWWWLYEKIGNKKIPIMNLAGGTEIGGAMLSVFPGMKLKPTTVGMPCPGFDLDIIDENQNSLVNQKGFLVIKTPWPTMTRSLLGDDSRYLQTYWSQYKDVWFHGDFVVRDSDMLWYMHGRVDDVISVSGHRLSTVKIERVVSSHPKVVDSAAISTPDDITGEAIVVFVVLSDKSIQDIQVQIQNHVSDKIGKLARPKSVHVISDMPKTRTGKVMRRLLKAKLLGESLGDLSGLENPSILDEIN
ncbi:MAG: acetate--CoA ligase [Thaumarchaeota archaeon]|nr:acetate--CoA ligase [Nitrososphaerota archaeon]